MTVLDDTATTATSLGQDAVERVAATIAEARDAAGRFGDAAQGGAMDIARHTPGIDAGGRSRRWRLVLPALLAVGVIAVIVARSRRDDSDVGGHAGTDGSGQKSPEVEAAAAAAERDGPVPRPDATASMTDLR